LNINNSKYLATNISNVYNVSIFLLNGSYSYNWSAYGNGTSNLINYSINRVYTVNNTPADLTAPNLIITSPANISYNINVSWLNYSSGDASWCWYSVNSGSTNVSVACVTNLTNLISAEGSNTWKVYCNDTSNNINLSSVTFFKDTISPYVAWISPTNSSYTTNSTTVSITNSSDARYIWWYNGTANLSYSSPVSLTLANGNYEFIAWANDSLNNVNLTSVSFVINYTAPDTTKPYFNSGSPYNMNVYTNESVTQQINATDNIGISCFSINNTINFQINCSGYFTNKTALTAGMYNLNVSVNDTSNNINSTIFYVNVSETPCVQSLQNTSFSSWINQGVCGINDLQLQNRSKTQYDSHACGVFANETIWDYQNVSCNYCSYNLTNTTWSGWTNLTCLNGNAMNQTRNLTQYDSNYGTCYAITGLPSDLWNSGNNMTFYEYRNTEYCQYDTTPPYFTTIPGATNINYSQSVGVLFVATDAVGFGSYAVNDSRFAINSTGWLRNATANLGVGSYNLNISINDTSNNMNYTIYQVTINKADLSLGLTATSPITYGTATDFTGSGCPSQLTCSLNISNGVYQVGIISANYSTAGNANYTANSTTASVTINKANSQTGLTFDKTSPQNYLTAITPTCSLTTGVGSVSLTNGTSGVAETLGADTWNFNCSYTGNTNYSSASNFSIFVINKANSSLALYLNNTQGNYPADNRSSQMWINSTLLSGTGNIQLYLNGSLINDGASPLSNLTNLSVGYYNITSIYLGNENYTSNSTKYWVNLSLQDTVPPYVGFISPENRTYNSSSVVLNINSSSDASYVWYNHMGVNLSYTTPITLTLTNGNYNIITYTNDTGGNVNSTSVSFVVNDTEPPVLSSIASSVTSSTAKITWTSDEISDAIVYYGKTETISNLSNSTFATSHYVTLSGLSASTLYYYNVSSCDYQGNCNISLQYEFTTSAISSPPSSGGGGGGGGGGSSAASSTSAGFTMSQSSVTLNALYEKELKKVLIKVKNTGKSASSFKFSSSESWIVVPDAIMVEAGEEKEVIFYIYAPEKIGVYQGKISVSSGKQTSEISVLTEVVSKGLFDVTATVLSQYKKVYAGSEVYAKIKLTNMGKVERTDVKLTYAIKKGNEVIKSYHDTLAVETTLDVLKNVAIAEDLPSGYYDFYVEVEYDGRTATASDSFVVVRSSLDYPLLVLGKYWIYVALAVVLIGVIVYILYRRRHHVSR